MNYYNNLFIINNENFLKNQDLNFIWTYFIGSIVFENEKKL